MKRKKLEYSKELIGKLEIEFDDWYKPLRQPFCEPGQGKRMLSCEGSKKIVKMAEQGSEFLPEYIQGLITANGYSHGRELCYSKALDEVEAWKKANPQPKSQDDFGKY
jgi:hypothetical protein